MNGKNFNKTDRKPCVLVAPLDWGLGHATRCIPIIKALEGQGCTVLLAGEAAVAALLQKEFPHLEILPLKGYRIRYSRRAGFFSLAILRQLPKICAAIRNERNWLKKLIAGRKIDAVISDNRPGLHHKHIPCIYITHQLHIETGNRFSSWLSQQLHYRYINKFSACWVPDNEGSPDLAGILSHPLEKPSVPVHYIGPLSRFENAGAGENYDLLVCLSGPEPQRTLFENILQAQLASYNGKVYFVRGTETAPAATFPGHIKTVGLLSSDELNKAMIAATVIISRSGYTSVMDLVKLQKKAVLVPTPGQKEQEYLAAMLMEQGLFYTVRQEDFSLQEALNKATGFSPARKDFNFDAYGNAVAALVSTLYH